MLYTPGATAHGEGWTLSWLIPAVVATLTATAVLALVYLHLYSLDRERHLRIMGLAWLVYALRFAFTLLIIDRGMRPLFFLAEQVAVYASGVLLAWGLLVMVRKRPPPAGVALAGLGLAWIPAAVALRLPVTWATLPTFTLLAALYVYAGWVFLDRAPAGGAAHRVVGWSFILWGLHKADYPFLREVAWFAPWGFLAAAALEGTIALGVIVISLHEARERLRLLQRGLEETVAARTEELRLRCEQSEALAADLRAANRDLESFSFTVAHDLRTPLRSITSFAQILREEQGERLDAEGRRHLERIAAGGVRLSTLMDDLLAYARLGRSEIALVPVDLASLVDSVCGDVAARAPGAVTTRAPFPAVLAARPILYIALLNLIRNALKFHRPGEAPRVVVSAATLEGRVRVRVADEGIGIPADQQEKIFELFERLHGPEEYPGTGIGLAIVRRAVERLGGRRGVESAPGLGSTFWIELAPAPGGAVAAAR